MRERESLGLEIHNYKQIFYLHAFPVRHENIAGEDASGFSVLWNFLAQGGMLGISAPTPAPANH